VANVSYLRTPSVHEQRLLAYDRLGARRRRRGPWVPIGVGLVLVVAALAAGAIVLATSSASLTPGPDGLATVGMPTGGGTLEQVSVLAGQQATKVPVVVRGNEIWPRRALPAGQRVSVQVVVRRPGWMSWLTGSTQRVTLSTVTPSSSLRSRFLTLHRGQPLQVVFDRPVRVVEYGPIGALHRRVLSSPATSVTLPRSSVAGSIMVAGTPRTWERLAPSPVSWFPAGLVRASAVASPSPGSRLGPDQPITLTFSKPVRSVLKSNPALSPGGAPGSWRLTSGHTLTFQPTGYGYGLGATVKLALPAGVGLVGGHTTMGGAEASWTVPGGSIVRLHQLLAQLGYLPLNFNYAHGAPGSSPAAQLNAAVHPPAGTFTWRWSNIPAALRADWSPTASGVMTKGAIMAFEANQGLISNTYASPLTDGIATPAVWRALIKAAIAHQRSTFGYTFVSVSEGSPENETTWHNGKVVVHGLVNTGISSAPTAKGTFPTFTHLRVTTMSGTNPDGSHYSDPGIPYTSYFNGGDALHGFIRGSYGFPQSLGCVEMPFSEAGAVFRYTPIGTLVHVF
jgi:peptidoglycan hydrolase-like protein with peptidoglycan-binding domain